MEIVTTGTRVVLTDSDEYGSTPLGGTIIETFTDGRIKVKWDDGDTTFERVGEASMALDDVYADVQAQIRDNHEKLISGELTPDSAVEHPKHYNSHPSGVECVTIAQHHTFCIGNVLKYLWRAGLKGEATELEDLRKARQYLDFEIERIEQSEV